MFWHVIHGFVLTAFVAGSAAASQPQHWRDMMPSGPWIDALGYGAGNYRTFSNGRFAYSSNAIDWTEVAAPTNRFIGDVVFGNGVFVAAGMDPGFNVPYQLRKPLVLVSSNGLDWVAHQLPGDDLRRAAFGNGVFVAVGSDNILTSTNGHDWFSTKPAGFLQLSSVDFVGDRFLALGNLGLILESTNGLSWVPASLSSSVYLTAAARGGDTTVVVGDDGGMFKRTPGEGWSSVGIDDERNHADITYGNGRFVAVGGLGLIGLSSILVSTNGSDWMDVQPGRFHWLTRIVFTNGQFVAGGNNGTILTSTNGMEWTIRRGGVPTLLWSLAEGNGLVAAVGGIFNSFGTVLTSSGDLTWHSQLYTNYNYLLRVIYTNGTFLAVGSGGLVSESADGTNWTARPTALTDWLFDVVYAQGVYVSAARNRVQWSTNGVDWNSAIASTNVNAYFAYLAFGNGKFVVLGDQGNVASSSNLIDWVAGHTGSTQAVNSIAFGQGVFVAVGNAGTVLRSSDGLAWNTHATFTTNDLRGMRFIGDRFFAVGSQGTILSSLDGIAWEISPSGLTTDLYDVALARNRIWITGWGTVLISDPLVPSLSSPHCLADGSFRFRVDFAYRPYALQSSTDGGGWNEVPEEDLTRSGVWCTVHSPTNASMRIFRAVVE